jgi:hypothetical protein
MPNLASTSSQMSRYLDREEREASSIYNNLSRFTAIKLDNNTNATDINDKNAGTPPPSRGTGNTQTVETKIICTMQPPHHPSQQIEV